MEAKEPCFQDALRLEMFCRLLCHRLYTHCRHLFYLSSIQLKLFVLYGCCKNNHNSLKLQTFPQKLWAVCEINVKYIAKQKGKDFCPCLYGLNVDAVLFLHALQVRTVAGVNLYEVTLVDKQGHADFYTSLQCGGLGSVGSGITLDARL